MNTSVRFESGRLIDSHYVHCAVGDVECLCSYNHRISHQSKTLLYSAPSPSLYFLKIGMAWSSPNVCKIDYQSPASTRFVMGLFVILFVKSYIL